MTASTRAPSTACWHVAVAGTLVGAGGSLLALQVDAAGRFCGTGLAALGIGTLVALAASIAQVAAAGKLPRDGITAYSAVVSFLGLAFVVGGVLAPGGPWMFLEVFVLLAFFVALRRRREPGPRWIVGPSLLVLAAMLVFRLWISYQGSVHRWEVLSLKVPVLSWIPLELLEPIQSVSLGEFTPEELGFPPAGLGFALSMAMWSIGFCLCAAGLALAQHGAREHENDRIHGLIATLPPSLATLVERLIPEEEWQDLGLHGLSERRLARRIEALAAERFHRQREIQRAFHESERLALPEAGSFAGGVVQALRREEGS